MLIVRNVWQSASEIDKDRLRSFYLRENTFETVVTMESRIGEILLIVEDAGEIVAISRAFRTIPPQFLQPFYYLSVFVGKANRDGRILNSILKRSVQILDDYARQLSYTCVGIYLELYNKHFYEKAGTWRRKGLWKGSQFFFAGKSIRGYDLRIHYFPDAQLKEPGELHA